jgi:hypothetical protein
LGYLFLLEECPKSMSPVKNREPHFPVFAEFKGASYAKRYELFCRKLVRERHYSAATFLMSNSMSGLAGEFNEPADDLAFTIFVKSIAAQISIYSKK